MSRSPLLFLLLFLVFASAPAQALSNSQQAEQAGAILFRDKGCAYCHGLTAAGTAKGPSLADVRKTLKPAQIVDQITNGGEKMPAFQDALTAPQIAQLVAWLRAKNRPVPPPATQIAPLTNPAH